jgi:thioredoxin 1
MLIDPQSRQALEKKYDRELEEGVSVQVFTRDVIIKGENMEYAQFCKQFVRELSQINNKIKAEYLSFGDEHAKKLNLSLSPTIVIGENNGYSIQYWGVPAGQVASSVIETITLVSQRKSGLSEYLIEKLKSVDKDVLIETYFNLESPASSQAILLSNRIAVERPDSIMSRSIEVEEAIERAKNLNIRSSPSVFINNNQDSLLSGLITEEKLIYQLIRHGASNNETILAQMEEEEKKKKTLAQSPDYPVILSTANFDEAVKKYPNLVIDCWAEWCTPCLMVHPIIENLAKKYKGKIAFAKLDIDRNKEIAERFNIMSIPTLLVFKNGQNIDSILGAMPENVLEERIGNYLA